MFDSFLARVCRTSAACSLGRGYWALQFSVSRACRLARVYARFAWQAWGIMAAYARRWIAGWRFAWEVWGMVDGACQEDGGRAFRAAGVGLRMHVGVWEGAAGCRCEASCTLRFLSGVVHFDVAQRAFRMAGVGNRARSVRFAWQAWGMV